LLAASVYEWQKLCHLDHNQITPWVQERLDQHLLPDEEVLGLAEADIQAEAMVVTDRRIFIISRGLLGGQRMFQRQVRTWVYPQIANVEFNTGITSGYLVLFKRQGQHGRRVSRVLYIDENPAIRCG